MSGADWVVSFTVPILGIRGRFVRLKNSLREALDGHQYPLEVKSSLGEASVLAVMFASLLKSTQRVRVQTQTDGAIHQLISHVVRREEGDFGLRACARFSPSALQGGSVVPLSLIGKGHLAVTLEQVECAHKQYQGIVALSGDLAQAVCSYFCESEQIETRCQLASGVISCEGDHDLSSGLMIQKIAAPSEAGGVLKKPFSEELQGWEDAEILFSTLRADELLDPSLAPDHLLKRLFSSSGDIIWHSHPVEAFCSCSRSALLSVLNAFSLEDRKNMLQEHGEVFVTCDFCSKKYAFSREEMVIDP